MPNNRPHKIVLIEADHARRDHLKSAIQLWGFNPFSFDNELICLDNLHPLDPDLVISGNLPTENTFSFINSLKMINCDLPVLLISGDKHIQDYIKINGFSDIKVARKNMSPDEIKSLIIRALAVSNNGARDVTMPVMVGNSPEIVKLKKLIPKINQTNEAVLINGEPGTGKELFAEAIHKHSDRKYQPYIKVNAVRLPYRLLEDELFGNRWPALIDFPRHKHGALVAAQTCTLFLKEIGAIPEFLQVKLLQLIGGRIHCALTDSKKKPVDVRIIASTTKDLTKLAEKNLFRKDLYYRLNVLTLTIPPLRARVEDIPLLTDFFCYKHCFEFGRSCFQISSRTKEEFCKYHWPGNVRELENAVKNIVLVGDEEHLLERLVSSAAVHRAKQDKNTQHEESIDLADVFPDISQYLKRTNNYSLRSIQGQFVGTAERKLIRKGLETTNWNRKKAAVLLGISYKSLLNKLKLYNI
jgi:DNA-binding NtrC family response regulator